MAEMTAIEIKNAIGIIDSGIKKFWVKNGAWTGIVSQRGIDRGRKFCKIDAYDGDTLVRTLTVYEGNTLDWIINIIE